MKIQPILSIAHIIINIILTTALVISVVLLILTTNSPIKRFSLFTVLSGSMEPAIRTGSIVVTQPTDTSKLRKNDIISYSARDNASILVTHRLTEVTMTGTTTTFTTKGDANDIADSDVINPLRVKGKVIFTIPFLGYILDWVKKPLGFFVAIIIPALFILIREAIVMKKLIEKSAIERYEKHHSVTMESIIIIFLALTFGSMYVQRTVSYFSSGLVLSGNIFSTGHWSTPQTPSTNNPAATLKISEDGHTASFVVTHTSPYDHLSYELTYDTDTVPQGLTGLIPITGNDTMTKDGLTLGTCSTGGLCTYHTGIKNMLITIILTKGDGMTKTLTAQP